MPRVLVLAAALTLLVGCSKKKREEGPLDTAPPSVSGGEPKPGGNTPSTPGSAATTAGLPKIQPRARFKIPGERAYEQALQLSADGRTLAVALGGSKPKTLVWDLTAEPKMLAEFSGLRFALSPSGRLVFVAGGIQQGVYEVARKKLVSKAEIGLSYPHFRDENTLVASARSWNLATAAKGRIFVWNIAKDDAISSFEIPDSRFAADLLANGGKELWLFMTNNKFEVECYDLDSKKLVRTIKPVDDTGQPYKSAGIYSCVASDSSVFTSDVSKMRIYEAVGGKVVGSLPDDIWASSTGFIPGGTQYVARANPRKTKLAESDHVIYDWKAKKGLAVLTGHSSGQKEVLAAVSDDGKTLVSVSRGGEGLVFDLDAAK